MVFGWFNWLVNPIAVDIGTETIKLLQVEPREGQHRLGGGGDGDDSGGGAGEDARTARRLSARR